MRNNVKCINEMPWLWAFYAL